jgi:hypothetical protein
MAFGTFQATIGFGGFDEVYPAPAAVKDLLFPPGSFGNAFDPVFGPAEVMFARANGSIRLWGLCVLTPVWDAVSRTYVQNMTEVPNTANLGRGLYVFIGNTPMVAGQYGWFMIRGVTPVNCSASVAADTTFGITAVGQGGANTAGKQILGARVMTASTNTIVKPAVANLGDNVIQVPGGTEGWFVGGRLTGTGLAANTDITRVFPNYVLVNNVTTGAVNTNVTQTATAGAIHYNVARINNAVAQGAIT